MIRFPLSEAQFEQIKRYPRPNEQGGWQNLFLRLQHGIKHGGDGATQIEMTVEDAERVDHYSTDYGEGGWQNALLSIRPEVRSALAAVKAQQGRLL